MTRTEFLEMLVRDWQHAAESNLHIMEKMKESDLDRHIAAYHRRRTFMKCAEQLRRALESETEDTP